MAEQSAQGEQAARRFSDRDRFVAFSFCWAEAILELDSDRNITFAGGILPILTGKDTRALKGLPILDIIAEEDRPLAEQMLDAIARAGRFDNIHLRFKGANGNSQPLVSSGYRNPELENRYFLAFHLTGGLTSDKSLKKTGKEGLYDADSFGKMASKMLADGVDGADKMTLLELDGLAEAEKDMDEAQRENLMGAVGSVLKMSSINGDAAAKLGEGKYGVVHGDGLDVDAMKARISSLISNIAPEAEGISVGAATIETDGEGLTEEALTKGVIHAMNEFSKSKGGVSLEALSGNMDDLVKDAMETAETFNRVVKKSDFRMAMHPIIGIEDGVIHHYEALARFQGKHGESPYKYITFAEETGLIGAFDLSVVDKVIAWIDENKDEPMFASVAVNISGNSIIDKRYIDGLQERLKANPWTQGKLIFELTESSRVEDLETANAFIQNLRGLGYPVCLDDFGAGAASFQYLSAIDVDVVKIDGPVIKNAEAIERGRAFLTALASFCRELGVETIAEMVDTPETVSFCHDCGIDFVQGFLFGPPKFDLTEFSDFREKLQGSSAPGQNATGDLTSTHAAPTVTAAAPAPEAAPEPAAAPAGQAVATEGPAPEPASS